MTVDEFARETIVEHNERPRNKRPLEAPDAFARGYNPICGDDVTVYLRFDGDRIAEATFTGRSCAICQASASMLTETVAGLGRDEAAALAEQVRDTMTNPAAPIDELPGDLPALGGVRRIPLRVKCATLSWNALREALARPAGPASAPGTGPAARRVDRAGGSVGGGE